MVRRPRHARARPLRVAAARRTPAADGLAIEVAERDETSRLFFGAASAMAIYKCPPLDDRDAVVGFVGVSFVNAMPERADEVFGKIRAGAWRITGALTAVRE